MGSLTFWSSIVTAQQKLVCDQYLYAHAQMVRATFEAGDNLEAFAEAARQLAIASAKWEALCAGS